MPRRGFFKVEEIGTTGNLNNIYFKGKKKSLFDQEELVRSFFGTSRKYINEIISLAQGRLDLEAEFARNVFELAGNCVKEVRICARETRRKSYYVASDLKLLKHGSISGVLPHHGLKYSLASRGLGGGHIFCHMDLHEPPKTKYDEERRDEAIKRFEGMRDLFVFFNGIKDIEIEDQKPEVSINKDEYEKLRFDQIYGTPLIMGAVLPKTIGYKKRFKKYGIKFPINKVTFAKIHEDRGLDPSRVIYEEDLFFPAFLLDSMTIIHRVMEKANIEVDSIYVDGSVKYHARNRKGNILLFGPTSAKIILKKDREKIVTPTPVDKAISLSYLYSKDIWIRNVTGAYTV